VRLLKTVTSSEEEEEEEEEEEPFDPVRVKDNGAIIQSQLA